MVDHTSEVPHRRRRSMTGRIADRAFDRVPAPGLPQDPAWLRELVDQIDREFMAGPPLSLHLWAPEVLAGVWSALRESALAGPTDRAVREVIAATVSTINTCPFCVDSHTAAASVLGADRAAKAVRAGSIDRIERDDLRQAAQWAAATRSPGDPRLARPPFAAADEPYAIGTACVFHYINRMVNAFLKPWPISVPPHVNRRGFMTRVNGVFPGRLLGIRTLEPGASLRFCRSTALPVPELARLAAAPAVALGIGELFSRAETAGRSVLSDQCLSVVGDAIAAWDGADPGLGGAWCDDIVAELPPSERSTGAFALSCALASYRVDRHLTDDVRVAHPSNREVVSIAAWASARATRRIATWV